MHKQQHKSINRENALCLSIVPSSLRFRSTSQQGGVSNNNFSSRRSQCQLSSVSACDLQPISNTWSILFTNLSIINKKPCAAHACSYFLCHAPPGPLILPWPISNVLQQSKTSCHDRVLVWIIPTKDRKPVSHCSLFLSRIASMAA